MGLTVLKIGGSLSFEPAKLRVLMQKLDDLSQKYRIVIVPGGGEFADTVRKLNKQFCLDSHVSHHMAILGMDQYGLLLSSLSSNSACVQSFDEAIGIADSGKLPIFLPSQVMFREDPLENSWRVTSDSIALYIAHRLQAEKLLLVTDVDGVYTSDPKKELSAALIRKIASEELKAIGIRTSVDSALPGLLKNWPLPCFVVNGFYPERVEALLEGEEAVCTLINSKRF